MNTNMSKLVVYVWQISSCSQITSQELKPDIQRKTVATSQDSLPVPTLLPLHRTAFCSQHSTLTILSWKAVWTYAPLPVLSTTVRLTPSNANILEEKKEEKKRSKSN